MGTIDVCEDKGLFFRALHALGKLRLAFNYLMALAAIYSVSHTGKALLAPALLIVALGMLIRVSAAGHIVKKSELSKGGPYAYTRNPLYVGSLFVGIGTYLFIRDWWLLAFFLVGFGLFYGGAIAREETYLFNRYGREFEQYKSEVPILFPQIRCSISVRDSQFSWIRVIRNDEHIAAGSTVLVLAIISLIACLR